MTSPAHEGGAPQYPEGTVQHLLDTDLVTRKTREVLDGRVQACAQPSRPPPRFFSDAEIRTLAAVCARLIPQPGREHPIDIARAIDERLAQGKSDGWRYDSMPPDADAYRLELRGLDETARIMFGTGGDHRFESLSTAQQDMVLAAVKRGDAQGVVWTIMPATTFMEELLAEAVEFYYSHPLAEDEIGFAGMADAHGWQRIGLDELASFEPRSLNRAPSAAKAMDAVAGT